MIVFVILNNPAHRASTQRTVARTLSPEVRTTPEIEIEGSGGVVVVVGGGDVVVVVVVAGGGGGGGGGEVASMLAGEEVPLPVSVFHALFVASPDASK